MEKYLTHQELTETLVKNSTVPPQMLGDDVFHVQINSEIDDENFKGYANSIAIRKGITFFFVDYTLKRNLVIQNIHDKPFISIYFLLGGKTIHRILPGKKIHVEASKGQCAIIKRPKCEIEVTLPKTRENYKLVGFHFTEQAFFEYAKDYISHLPENVLNELKTPNNYFKYVAPIDARMRKSLEQIKDCKYEQKHLQFYVESKLLEGFIYILDQLVKAPVVFELDKQQKESLEEVKNKIINNCSSPTSLLELAKDAGMSKSRFIKSFNTEFGVTPYQMIKTAKLTKAKQLIETGEYRQINEVATIVGYDSHEAFTRAFKERFNVAPRDLLKIGLN